MTDDVLQRVREVREEFARRHNYDAFAMVAALRQSNEADDRLVVRLPPRPVTDAADGLPKPGRERTGAS